MSDLPHGVSAVIVKGKPVRLHGQQGAGHSPGHAAGQGAGHGAGHGPGHGAAQYEPLLPRRRAAQAPAGFPAVHSALAFLSVAVRKHAPSGTVALVSAQV